MGFKNLRKWGFLPTKIKPNLVIICFGKLSTRMNFIGIYLFLTKNQIYLYWNSIRNLFFQNYFIRLIIQK